MRSRAGMAGGIRQRRPSARTGCRLSHSTLRPRAIGKGDIAIAGALAAFAFFIWTRQLGWLEGAADTLPILAALPLFIWLRSPWKLSAGARLLARGPLIAAAVLFPLGILLDLSWMLAASWTALLWSWISVRFEKSAEGGTRKLLVLPFISFPWIALDFERIGWWFRLSGAAAAEKILGAFNFEVARDGTFLLVDDFLVSVAPACSGVNGLQSMLIAGTMLLFFRFRNSPLFWWNLPVLVAAAWVANLARIAGSAAFGASIDPAIALQRVEQLHTIAGWAALLAMFVLCWFLFGLQEKIFRKTPRRESARLPRRSPTKAGLPLLELAILAFSAWSASDLYRAWFTAPYDRLGWLAFGIWALPLVLKSTGDSRALGTGRFRPLAAAAGLALSVLGTIGQFNILQHAGLALVLTAFSAPGGRLLWAAACVSWLPALGWLLSRFGLGPDAAAYARVLLACGAAATAFLARQPRTARPLLHARRNQVA